MKLEDQVCSLDLAKRLKELGVKQESAFYWFPFGGGVHKWQLTKKILDMDALRGWRSYEKNNKDFSFYAAFTVAELGEMLPSVYRTRRTALGEWLSYSNDAMNGPEDHQETVSESEADARAKMLISFFC